MKKLISCIFLCGGILICAILGSACKKLEKSPSDALYNYDVLWQTIDERYCYFSYKNIDWDSLYSVYRFRLQRASNSEEIFNVFCALLANLKDGHVNLYTAGDVGRYWNWYLDYPKNYSEDLIEDSYLGLDYRIAAAFRYKKLQRRQKNIGYIRYNDFSQGFGEGNVYAVFSYFDSCEGLILDLRGNGGGNLSYAQDLASHFAQNEIVYGYTRHKTGRGHDEFSDFEPQSLKPSMEQTRWKKKVAVLVDRSCYSTTNDFACIAKSIPSMCLIGDSTGGGGGLPFMAELPCGWMFRFSAVPMFDANYEHIENGIAPDVYCVLDAAAAKEGVDSVIERAVEFLLGGE